MTTHQADVAIVGAGIVGLAHAWAAAKRGLRVVLLERTDWAVGASIRNFGLIWPVGQPSGPAHHRAMRARELWREVVGKAGLYCAETGSLHLAYREDEQSVLEEFMALDGQQGHGRVLLSAKETLLKSAAVQASDLRCGLWSPTEAMVDPREAIRRIPHWLAKEFGVQFRFGQMVLGINAPELHTATETWRAAHIFVCTGADFELLYPEVFAGSGITKCKLQMMRTAPQPDYWQLGPSLCAGLTLTHYDSFKNCHTLAALEQRVQDETPFYVEHGIHVLLSQTRFGELTIGDSHHYGLTLEPFDREDINAAINAYLRTFAVAPLFEIAERWNGVYPKLKGKTEFIAEPEKGVTVVNGLGGAGMTMSFGLAEETVARL
jgi:FAD dependent oxidoreductase TIGR03364